MAPLDSGVSTIFSDAIASQLNGNRKRSIDLTGAHEKIRQGITSKLDEQKMLPGGSLSTGFSHIFRIDSDRFVVNPVSPTQRKYNKLDVRNKEEMILHILLQSHLRVLGCYLDQNNNDSIMTNDLLTSPEKKFKSVGKEGADATSISRRLSERNQQLPIINAANGSDSVGHAVFASRKELRNIGSPCSRQSAHSAYLRSTKNVQTRPLENMCRAPGHGPGFVEVKRIRPGNQSPVASGDIIQHYQLVKMHDRPQFRFHNVEDKNGFFSNFWEGKSIDIDGDKWKTVEHYFQAQKFQDLPGDSKILRKKKAEIRKRIQDASTPAMTKEIARSACARDNIKIDWKNWEDARINVMHKAVFAKFYQDAELKNALLSTNTMSLVEAMPAGRSDDFWGAVIDNVSGEGRGVNLLGQILSKVRLELMSGATSYTLKCKFDLDSNQRW